MSGRTVADVWPLAAVVVRTPRVELRWPSTDDLLALAALAEEGIHDEGSMPFLTPWTRGTPAERAQNVRLWNWRRAGEWERIRWLRNPVAVVGGEVVGTQGMVAADDAVTRTAETGSYLGGRHQGQGIGKEMRAAILHLLFAGLDAVRATTGAFEDNAPSLGVTRSLGYRPAGDRLVASEGRCRRQLLYVMDRADWAPRRRDDIELSGVDAARPFLGLPERPDSQVEAAGESG
jgi:RimJ/RimL family protein N-acetyltransferase